MKKLITLVLALAMTLSLAACGSSNNGGASDKAPLTDDLNTVIEKITTEQPVEFAAMNEPLDLTDTSEDGMWRLQSFTGLENADLIQEAAVFEPMMGSLAFSMVLVRVKDAANAKTVAEQMKAGIDPRKWVCVEANDIQVAGYSDVVMFIMVDTYADMSSQPFVDAFQKVCGGELDFVL